MQREKDEGAYKWFKAALIWLLLSSLGTFALAYLMSSHNLDPKRQLAAVYFFLHFQYNGWFFFACMGLAVYGLYRQGIRIMGEGLIFRLFAFACMPAYLLSILWWDIPAWTYVFVVMAALSQFLAWGIWLFRLAPLRMKILPYHSSLVQCLLIAVIIAATIKVLLQTLSVVPSLSQLAFSFRPIVIGYLHLVLLATISVFILTYACIGNIMSCGRIVGVGLWILLSGILLNELLLMLQGVSGLLRTHFAGIPVSLTVAAGCIVTGVALVLIGQCKSLSSS